MCPKQLIIAVVASCSKAAQTGSIEQTSPETKMGAMSPVRQDRSVFETWLTLPTCQGHP